MADLPLYDVPLWEEIHSFMQDIVEAANGNGPYSQDADVDTLDALAKQAAIYRRAIEEHREQSLPTES